MDPINSTTYIILTSSPGSTHKQEHRFVVDCEDCAGCEPSCRVCYPKLLVHAFHCRKPRCTHACTESLAMLLKMERHAVAHAGRDITCKLCTLWETLKCTRLADDMENVEKYDEQRGLDDGARP